MRLMWLMKSFQEQQIDISFFQISNFAISAIHKISEISGQKGLLCKIGRNIYARSRYYRSWDE